MSLLGHWLARYRGAITGWFVGLAVGGAFLKQVEPTWGGPGAVSIMMTVWGLLGLLWVVGVRRWLARSIPADRVSRADTIVQFGDYLIVALGMALAVISYLHRA